MSGNPKANWRAKTLEALKNHRKPMTAYDVLGELRQFNPKIAPPTVYRALSALAEDGLIHRLESLNAYVCCQKRDPQHTAILSICDDCGVVEECQSGDVMAALGKITNQVGFQTTRHVIELHGHCTSCQEDTIQ